MAKIIDRDKGWRAIEKTVKAFGGREVAVGVLSDAGTHAESGADMVVIAAANEFGAPSVNVPERSYIRSTVDAKRRTYGRVLNELSKHAIGNAAVSKRSGSADRQLRKFALLVQSDIQHTMVRLQEPPNEPSTIARKGSSNPLIDTSQLKNSITGVVRPAGTGSEGI